MTSASDVARAADVLRAGGLVAFPTETVYGLGADALNVDAVERVFAVKGRPARHPLIVHLGDASWLPEWVRDFETTTDAYALADVFWPGPLTMVLPRTARVPDVVTGGRDTVAVRVPGAPIAQQLLAAFGSGIAAPSANRFGRVSPTTADDVRADLGADVDMVLNGPPCLVGVESTIVELLDGCVTMLRPGAITADAVETVLGRPIARVADGEARAPGMLAAHYSPRATIELLDGDDARKRAEALARDGVRVGILMPEPANVANVVDLGPAGDPDSYAHMLYQRLREADRRGLDVLVVAPPPAIGIGVAVRDRLGRAAHRGA